MKKGLILLGIIAIGFLLFLNVNKQKGTSAGSEEQSQLPIPILMYHTVNEEDKNDTINTKPANFDEQINALVEEGYNGITPFQLYAYYFENEPLPEKPILITFDDGYKDNYTNAYPVLKKYGMPATIFVIASRIQHEGEGYFPGEMEKITWEDAMTMDDYITIQNHTWDSHRKIVTPNGKEVGQIASPQLKEDNTWETQQEYEARVTEDLIKAQQVILEKLNYPSVMISYPYGQSNETVQAIASDLGAKLGVTVKKGVNVRSDAPMTLNRITVDGNMTGKELIQVLEKNEM